MKSNKFKYHPLQLVNPEFGSNLTDLIIELDFERKRILQGSTLPIIFFQLKGLFHTLESIGSARIEGNRTTIAEYIETKISETGKTNEENFREIQNMEKALSYIDDNIQAIEINRRFVSDLHKMVVKGLSPNQEGDPTPGVYRSCPVEIKGSSHFPPSTDVLVNQYMEELFEFINTDTKPQYKLLKCAIAHHRFVWVHPFRNGNGRTVRLFTYAMLVKLGFRIDKGQRILNPTAVFCSDRELYYDKLSKADSGNPDNIMEWCEYVLEGLRNEIVKIDKLLDYEFLKSNVLLPALNYSIDRKFVTEKESKILRVVIEKQKIKSSDVKFISKDATQVSRYIRSLIDKQMLTPIAPKKRAYTLRFTNNYLLRGVIKALEKNGFIPVSDES
jgi:Fic family protein